LFPSAGRYRGDQFKRRGQRLDYHAVVTTRLALDEPHILRSDTIGDAWFAVAGRIVATGVPSRYDDLPIREISLVTLVVARPDPHDEIIARHAEPERLAWMHANFTARSQVAALGNADSYATRLFDYEHSGRDQIRWAIDRLRADPTSRSATITTFRAFCIQRLLLFLCPTHRKRPGRHQSAQASAFSFSRGFPGVFGGHADRLFREFCDHCE
jgi:hypothetical protein